MAVAAREVLATIALDSPHYAPKPQREDKRKRRAVVRGKKSGALEVLAGARVMAEQMEEQAGVLGTAVLAGDAADGGAAAAAAFAAGSATAAGAGDDDDEVALPELSFEFLLSAHTDRPMQDDEPVEAMIYTLPERHFLPEMLASHDAVEEYLAERHGAYVPPTERPDISLEDA